MYNYIFLSSEPESFSVNLKLLPDLRQNQANKLILIKFHNKSP